MALNFPASPSNGDSFAVGGITYTYNATKEIWVVNDTRASATVFVSNVAPSPAVAGDVYWDTETGRLYVYYNDGDTSQWVEATNVTGAFPTLDTDDISEASNLYFTNTRAIGALTAGINMIIDSNGMLTANVVGGTDVDLSEVSQNIIPSADVTFDLGSSSYRWKDLYLSGNTIILGDIAIKSSNGSIIVSDVEANGYIVPSETLVGGSPSLLTISGEIRTTIASNLTIIGTGFGLAATVRFTYGGSTTDVSVTPSSSTQIVVSVPSAVYNQPADTAVTISVISGGKITDSANITIGGLPTGGTITTSGDYRIHTFTSSGNFVVPSGLTLTDVEYLVIAGGGAGGIANTGGGGEYGGGGGGAGGYRCAVTGESSGGGSSAESKLTLIGGTYTVTVGIGGTNMGNGTSSSISTIVSAGGGGNGAQGPSTQAGSGGSGGGGAGGNFTIRTDGAVGTSGQGFAGENGVTNSYGGGGGGASEAGGTDGGSFGGDGISSSITGTAITRAGGGGGGRGPGSNGGDGGGGNGAGSVGVGSAGTTNTGSGGGGAAINGTAGTFSGGNGGSGIVIIRYQL